jgi:hypothetical protein
MHVSPFSSYFTLCSNTLPKRPVHKYPNLHYSLNASSVLHLHHVTGTITISVIYDVKGSRDSFVVKGTRLRTTPARFRFLVGPRYFKAAGIATGYGLDGPVFESRCGRDYLRPSRPVLGPTGPTVQRVPGLFPGGKAAEACRWPHTPYCAEVNERVELYLHFPSRTSWPIYRTNFTSFTSLDNRREEQDSEMSGRNLIRS